MLLFLEQIAVPDVTKDWLLLGAGASLLLLSLWQFFSEKRRAVEQLETKRANTNENLRASLEIEMNALKEQITEKTAQIKQMESDHVTLLSEIQTLSSIIIGELCQFDRQLKTLRSEHQMNLNLRDFEIDDLKGKVDFLKSSDRRQVTSDK